MLKKRITIRGFSCKGNRQLGTALIILPCLLFFYSLIHAQNGSTATEIKAAKAEWFSEQAWTLREVNPDSSIWYAREALQLAVHLGMKKIEAYSLSDISNYYKRREEYDSAYNYLARSLVIRQDSLDSKDHISGLNLMAILFRQQEQYDSAKVYYSVAIDLCSLPRHTSLKAKLLDGRGMVKIREGEYAEGLEDIASGLEFFQILNDTLAMAKSWHNIGVVNQELQNLHKAKLANEKARKLYIAAGVSQGLIEILVNQAAILALEGNLVDAQLKLEQSLNLSRENGYLANLSAIYNNLAFVFSSQGEMGRALEYHYLDYQMAIDNKKENAVIEAGLNLFRIQLDLANVVEAKKLFHELSPRIHSQGFSWFSVEFRRLSSQYYGQLGDYKQAYFSSIEALRGRDSLVMMLNEARQQENIISTERQERSFLEQVNQKQFAEIQTQRANQVTIWVITGTIILIFLFLVTTLVILRRNQKLKLQRIEAERDRISERNHRLEKDQMISVLIKQAEEKTSRVVSETQEKVQNAVARDLHDQVGSNLSLVQIMLSGLSNYFEMLPIEAKVQLGKAEDILDASCADVRRISYQMKTGGIESHGLGKSMAQFFEVINTHSGLYVEFFARGQLARLDANTENDVSSMIKTFIDNVLRHSGADKAMVDLYVQEERIYLKMEDNGKGFDIHDSSFRRGSGLGNIETRAAKLNGGVRIQSQPGAGTSISIEMKS